MSSRTSLLVAVPLALSLAGCGDSATLPEEAAVGPNPSLPPPASTLIPTVKIAPAKGWPAGAKPAPAAGLAVNAYATGLDHPRWLHVLPNGDVLVAETNAPPRPEDGSGIKGLVYKQLQKRAGAGVPSANRLTLLRDADGDGVAETRTVFLKDLNSPFGMALVGNDLYVANTDAVVRVPYRDGQTQIDQPPVKVADLPGGPLNHHWTKGLLASRDGARLYVSVGSNSNVGENGLDKEERRAAILEIDPASGQSRVFASGLRNPVGMALEPQTGALWAVVNERDELGSDLVPDYLTSVKDGAFYERRRDGAHLGRPQRPEPSRPSRPRGPNPERRVQPRRPTRGHSRQRRDNAPLGCRHRPGLAGPQRPHGPGPRRRLQR